MGFCQRAGTYGSNYPTEKMLFVWERSTICSKTRKSRFMKYLSCLLLFYLTPHIYSSAERLTPDDSLVKLSLSDDNSQTGLLSSDRNKSIKVGENDPDVDHRGWHCHFFSNRRCYWNYQGNKQVCFPRKNGKIFYSENAISFFFRGKLDSSRFTRAVNIVIITQKKD